jgi:hypothetical protein
MNLSKRITILITVILCGFEFINCAVAADDQPANPSIYSKWKNGPPVDLDFFPIAVWLQNPKNAAAFKAAGINVYVALWHGPTQEQLSLLHSAGLRVICAQNKLALAETNNPTIIGWMHDDEPDNAQSLGKGKGYGPPVLPETIVQKYRSLREADPSRPVFLNLGQGVAWDNYIGRGVRRNHPEDYREYALGADIVSFDIYPAVHTDAPVAGKLEFVAKGVERLITWTDRAKPVWNCIEASRISNTKTKPTVAQIRAEVWMSLIHGSRGLVYFVHQFEPTFKEASLLDDPELLPGVSAINHQIHSLAAVLNSPSVSESVQIESSDKEVPIASMVKRLNKSTYVFTVGMRNAPTRGSFKVQGMPNGAKIEVLGEDRIITASAGEFTDEFEPYGVHLYRIAE